MKIVSKQEFEFHKAGFLRKLKTGTIFIYPTDTIYGIGCNALVNNSAKIIRDIKGTPQPFSIIVPSKEWITDNCVVTEEAQEWIDKLPGPYTIVLPLKENSFFSKDISPNQKDIGIRMPNHWITQIVNELGYPIISTSVNEHGHQFITRYEDLPKTFETITELFIEEGEIDGRPSKIVRFTDGPKIIER